MAFLSRVTVSGPWTRRRNRKEEAPTPSHTNSVVTPPTSFVTEGSTSAEKLKPVITMDQESDSEEDSKVEAIMALRNVVLSQRAKLEKYESRQRLHHQQIQQLTSKLQSQAQEIEDDACTIRSERKRVVAFVPSFERSDELSGLTSLGTAMSKELLQAVSSIKEQASHVETAIALDELQSVKSDRERLYVELDRTRDELDSARQELKDSQMQISLLELEKELVQAEATKAKEDFQDCMHYVREHMVIRKEIAAEGSTKRSVRNLFHMRSNRQSRYNTLKSSSPIVSDEEVNFQSAKDMRGEKILCFACRMQQHKCITVKGTPTKSLPSTSSCSSPPVSYVMAPTPAGALNQGKENHAERTRDYAAEIAELRFELQQVQGDLGRKEKKLVHRVYSLEHGSEDAILSYRKQLQLKESQIAQLRKEVSILRQHEVCN